VKQVADAVTLDKQIKATIRSDTQFAMSQFRTQLFNAHDLDNVHKIQDGYKVRP
jgi:hypothetical protein